MTDAAIRAAERSGDTYSLAVALIRAGRAAEALKVRGGYQAGDIVAVAALDARTRRTRHSVTPLLSVCYEH